MRVELDIGRGIITIEGDGADLIKVLERAREIAPSLKEIRLLTSGSPASRKPKEGQDSEVLPPLELENGKNGGEAGAIGARPFAKLTAPANIAERIAVVAYYINRYEGKDSFTPKELSDLFERFGFERPSQMPVALFSAKKRYGFVESSARGVWKLTIAGGNFVTRKVNGPAAA